MILAIQNLAKTGAIRIHKVAHPILKDKMERKNIFLTYPSHEWDKT